MGVSLAGSSAPAASQTEGTGTSQSAEKTQEISADDAGPSLEFLEFLGTWESAGGDWIDPAEVQSADWPIGSDDRPDAKDAEIGNAN